MVKKSSSTEDFQETTRHSSSCKYKGVRKRKWGKWVSEIRLPNSRERIWLGSYDSPEKAARAFDAAQFCLRGRGANFNFPDNPPQIAGVKGMTPAEIQTAAARFANLTASVGDHITTTTTTTTDFSDRQRMAESDNQTESITYSPSISDGTTVQMDSEFTGVEVSFQEQLSLSSTLGSGNYVSEFGYFTGFEDFTTGGFFTASQPENFDYNGEDTYDASLYQDSCLWNF